MWDDAHYFNVKIDSWIGRKDREIVGKMVMLLEKGYREIEV